MKLIAEHLGEIILAVAGVSLIVGVVLCFSEPIGNFFSEILSKLSTVATSSEGIWATPSYSPSIGG